MTIDELKNRMPETSSSIQEEIFKQENLLEDLHKTVSAHYILGLKQIYTKRFKRFIPGACLLHLGNSIKKPNNLHRLNLGSFNAGREA